MKSLFAALCISFSSVFFLSPAAFSAQLDLACVGEVGTATETQVRRIVVVDNSVALPVLASSESRKVLQLEKYAVVIEVIPGEFGNPAREKWQVYTEDQYSIELLPGIPTNASNWRFELIDTAEAYFCGEDGVAQANPALTRSN